jgi:hypothetical protein
VEFVNRYNFGRTPDKSAFMMPASVFGRGKLWKLNEHTMSASNRNGNRAQERPLVQMAQAALRPVEIAGGLEN